MPKVMKVVRVATLPETRHFLVAAARSDALREAVHRVRSDRAGLLRDLADPATSAGLVRDAIAHPATRELASVGLVMLPGRYLPLGWVASRLYRRILGRDRNRSTAARAPGG